MEFKLTIFFLLISSFEVFSQSEIYSNKTSSDIQLYLYYDKKQFEVVEILGSEVDDELDLPDAVINVRYLLPGTIESKAEDDVIICRNGGRTFTFKRVDEYLIINHDMPYLGDSLYIVSRMNAKEHFDAEWKDGKKHGYWRYWEKGQGYFEKYYEGKLIIPKKKMEPVPPKNKIYDLNFFGPLW